MSRCPFWSTARERVECYNECPILTNEGQDGEQCIFHGCSEPSNINLKDIVKEDYNFLSFSIYDEDKNLNVNY